MIPFFTKNVQVRASGCDGSPSKNRHFFVCADPPPQRWPARVTCDPVVRAQCR